LNFLRRPDVIIGAKLEADSAKVAELVDALDLGSSAARRESSSLSFRTMISGLSLQPAFIFNFKELQVWPA
jgi:hypothetical protein